MFLWLVPSPRYFAKSTLVVERDPRSRTSIAGSVVRTCGQTAQNVVGVGLEYAIFNRAIGINAGAVVNIRTSHRQEGSQNAAVPGDAGGGNVIPALRKVAARGRRQNAVNQASSRRCGA